MARITIEDCLDMVPNRFALVIMASKRARQLQDGASATIETKNNKECVTALREAADGRIRFTRQVLPLIERHLRND
jgi:DNA-directed RNA polymerase subunit omega